MDAAYPNLRVRLPDGDPNSAIIRTWLASQPPGDRSAVIRQVLVIGITHASLLERWRTLEERITAWEHQPVASVAPPVSIDATETADPTLLATLLTFE